MDKHYDYRIGLLESQLERLDDATNALYGLTELRAQVTDDLTRPEWWTDFHEGVITSAMRLASNTLAAVMDDIREQASDQDREAGRG